MSEVIIRKIVKEYEVQKIGLERIYIMPSISRALRKARELIETLQAGEIEGNPRAPDTVPVSIAQPTKSDLPPENSAPGPAGSEAADSPAPSESWLPQTSQNLQAIRRRKYSQDPTTNNPKE